MRVGDVVLKPTGPAPEFAEWLGDIMASVVEDGFRVARPLRALTGAWSHDGWTASHVVAGVEPDHTAAPRWGEIIAAGRAFHRALAHLPRPGFLDRRRDGWATGDRVAWQEQDADLLPAVRAPYAALIALFGPKPQARPQLVHGDLTGNVLVAPGLAPAVIDFSPYWRPPAFGEAVVVADALIWHGAGPDLLHEAVAANGPDAVAYVARALVFRLVTTNERLREQPTEQSRATVAEIRRYEDAARLLAAIAPRPGS
ncbi:aminoglycoside phosphotransferase [Streptomyces sp. NPDC053474]|uniref:aminoglycoside phosphotransferase n=1 Tax=Streptomyces sp. NPDC053474 TaxID=3365704 RepID=UPI0037D08682